MKKYPALEQLMSCYLHMDWPEEYGEPWEGVEDFFRSEPENRRSIPGEVADLINSFPNEIELRRYLLKELDLGYTPEADGCTYRDWLEEISRRAAESASVVQFPVPTMESGPKAGE